ncbi:MAG: hypothetical protein Unbinned6004contig1002_14 [Prokaryotic dsDNA virus sp.]|nr:MAG: hypothetical protein Unbinned6004contig1002_14 [Prokaryotic dsDNA virus sp.]|tara:strand:- start:14141 stop:14860 length:720 start_codon:yes stop_codon:yes gene_type:complete
MLSFRDFSKQIIETGDIDPDYILIREKCKEYGWNKKQMFNWILHKLVIYDSYSELQVINKEKNILEVKYGTERRKSKRFAKEYLNNIQRAFIDINIEKFFTQKGYVVFNKIKTIKGYGSWAAWKFMDLISCCYGIDVDFETIDFRKAYTFPLKGLLMINDLPEDVKLLQDTKLYSKLMHNANKMLEGLETINSPHNNNKGLRINEVETLLCKYHSYKHNKYKVGQDIEHLNKRFKKCII